jgi:hypothetical protein
MIRVLHSLLGVLVLLRTPGTLTPGKRTAGTRFPGTGSERGLSQSAENAILLAGAVTIALGIIAAITAFVQGRLPR